MSIANTIKGTAARAAGVAKPVGSITVVDRSKLNWLYITYNTVEELVRVTPGGKVRPAAMRAYKWPGPQTLDVWLRKNNYFHTGAPVTTASVEQAFHEQLRWIAPHPPGTHFNIDRATRLEVLGDSHLRFHIPAPDGLFVGKLRAMHIMDASFWEDLGFGYARDESGEGHW